MVVLGSDKGDSDRGDDRGEGGRGEERESMQEGRMATEGRLER